MSFTGGPWKLGESQAGPEGEQREIVAEGDAIIARVWPVGEDFDSPRNLAELPEREANARLIAAAPELLTFAANAENTIAQYLAGHEVTGFARLLDEAHALLARVQGEG